MRQTSLRFLNNLRSASALEKAPSAFHHAVGFYRSQQQKPDFLMASAALGPVCRLPRLRPAFSLSCRNHSLHYQSPVSSLPPAPCSHHSGILQWSCGWLSTTQLWVPWTSHLRWLWPPPHFSQLHWIWKSRLLLSDRNPHPSNSHIVSSCIKNQNQNQNQNTFIYWFYRERRERERETSICCFTFYAFTSWLSYTCMCPDQGLNLQPWCFGMTPEPTELPDQGLLFLCATRVPTV